MLRIRVTFELGKQDLDLIAWEMEQDGLKGPFKREQIAEWLERVVQGRLTRIWDQKIKASDSL